VTSALERFFASYRSAFDRLDPDAIAAHYAVPSLLCTKAGRVAWTERAMIEENMRALCARYRDAGYRSASYEVVGVVERGTRHAVVDLLWTVERSGGAAWRFRTGYDVECESGTWRIAVCTAYEEGSA
jgi:uncharacterized NTF2-like protein DUF6841